jgi:hypothetical protein
VTSKVMYNFRLAPEAVWLIVNTVLGALLVELVGRFAGLSDLPSLTDLRSWGIALGLSAVRTGLGAILAAVTGGAFLKPGEQPAVPTSG